MANEEYGEFVGVDSLHYAKITADSDSAYTTEVPSYLAPAAEIAGSPKIANKTTYYDNKPANNYTTEGETELKMTVSNVPAKLAATLLGKYYDAATGRVLDTGDPNPPDVAVGFRYNMGKSGYRYYWYLKGTFSGGTEEAASKKDDVDVKTYELTFIAVTTIHQWTIDSELKSMKRVYADTSDEVFDPEGWFTQVQTPVITGSPAELSMSSSVPVKGATDVSKTGAITLTFSNAIISESVNLISDAGEIVTVTKEFDTAKKVLTITPSSALAATTGYIIAIVGVTDIYGQTLAAAAVNFTTAA